MMPAIFTSIISGPTGSLHPWQHTTGGWWKLVSLMFPPIPDIAMKKEEFLRRMGFDRLAKWMEAKEGEGICTLNYFTGRSPAMERQVMKFSLLEQSPAWFKRLWAHHRFLLFEKK